jgi:dTDP-4-amino-4,6-dideoxygalactose transaminase
VNARIGCGQLERLPEFLATRRALAKRYFANLATRPACLFPPRPSAADDDGHSWNMFCVLLPLEALTISRQAFREALEARGIATGVSYEALHLCTLGRRYGGHEGQFPNAERIARETVSLPLHAGMTEADVDRVCAAVDAVISAGRR